MVASLRSTLPDDDVRLLAPLEHPKGNVMPEMSPGADDSIYPRSLGIPTYGIDGMFDDLDDGRAHGRDERIGVAAFDEELEFTYRLMKELSARTGAV